MISWCLVTFGRAAVVRASIDNVLPCVGEVVWVDNCSPTGDALAIAERLRQSPVPVTRVRFPDNRGAATGHNTAFALARGDALLMCGGDMTFEPGALEAKIKLLSEQRAAGFPRHYPFGQPWVCGQGKVT